MPGGKAPKRKGDRLERDFIKRYGGKRTFWQPEGRSEKERRPDILDNPHLGTGEVKGRREFKTLKGWLGENQFLALKADCEPWWILLKADYLFELLRGERR